MSSPLKIACVGEVMIELIASSVPGFANLNVAGDTFNAAVYLRRALPCNYTVAYVTKLGRDSLSDKIISFIDSESINTASIQRDDERGPGLYSASTDDAGERSFQYWRNNSAARRLFQEGEDCSFDILNDFDVIYMSAISFAILPQIIRLALLNWLRGFREKGGQFAFDSNYRPSLWEDAETARLIISHAWSLCDIALPSLDDEMALYGDETAVEVLARFERYRSCKGVLKRAEQGPLPINFGKIRGASYKKSELVLDTTAAGDSFSGTFLAHYLMGWSVEDAMLNAHKCACQVVGFKGAIIPRKDKSLN